MPVVAVPDVVERRDPVRRGVIPRVRTRLRLILAAATVAAVLLAAVALQYTSLRRIDEQRAAAEEMEERLLVAIELESALRRQFAHQHLAATGHPEDVSAYADARRTVRSLSHALSTSLEDPEAVAWVAAIERAAAELDNRRLQLAGGGAVAADLSTDSTSALVLDVERNMARLFSMLGIATANHREAVTRGQDALHRLTIGLVLGTALFTVFLTLYLTRSVAAPLARLEHGVARIAGGHLDTRIDIRTQDEFGAVASQLNQVAARLQEHGERLSRAEALAAVGRTTAGVVHELNNSLQVMIGYATLDRDLVAGELANHLQRIEREARRSTEIVSGVLQMSRAPDAAEPVAVDLREVADEVASAVRLVHASDISVSGDGVAFGTRCRYHQILANLAKNAADAAGPAGRVRITVSSTDSATVVAVDDSGPGVPPESAARIFEPFFTTKPGGTGLGLAVSRSIAAGFGGTIEVGRSDLGGARFSLRVPRRNGA